MKPYAVIIWLIAIAYPFEGHCQHPSRPLDYVNTDRALIEQYLETANELTWKYKGGDDRYYDSVRQVLVLFDHVARRADIQPSKRVSVLLMSCYVYTTEGFENADSFQACLYRADSISHRFMTLEKVKKYYPNVLIARSQYHFRLLQIKESLGFCLQAIDSLKKYPSDVPYYNAYRGLGFIYRSSYMPDDARLAAEYFNTAAHYASKLEWYPEAKECLLEAAQSIVFTGKVERENTYYQAYQKNIRRADALSIKYELGREYLDYLTATLFHFRLAEYKQTILMGDSALSSTNDNEHLDDLDFVQSLIGIAYYRIGETQKAYNTYMKINPDKLAYTHLLDYYQHFHYITAATGHYKEAYKVLDRYHKLLDSTNIAKQEIAVAEILRKYNVAQKDLEIEKLENIRVHGRIWVIIIVALAIIGGLIFFFAYRRKQTALKSAIRRIEELAELQIYRIQEAVTRTKNEERRLLGMNIHDGLAATLSAAVHQLRVQSIQAKHSDEKAVLMQILSSIDNAYKQVRQQSHELFYGSGQADLFIKELKNTIRMFFAGTLIEVTYELDDPELMRLTAELKICILYVIKEACTNILKHSNAKRTDILMYVDRQEIHLHIADKGRLSSRPVFRHGVGLKSITERIAKSGGTIKIDNNGQGTTLIVALPIMA